MICLRCLLCFMSIQNVLSVLVTMKGGEYITYDVSNDNIIVDELRIVFKFKTIDPSGLLLFSENSYLGDYISLELIDGKLRYKARLGFEDTSEQEIIIGKNLNNYNWHVVDVVLEERNVSIELDYQKTSKSFGGEFKRFDLNQKIYFGGFDETVDVSPYKITNRKYSGCLENFFFNNVDILYHTKFIKPGFTTHGDLLWSQCEDLYYQPIMFKNPQDHALLPTYQQNSLSVSFKFRTHIGEGLLFAKIARTVSVHIGLRKGILIFNVQIKGQGPIVMTQGNNLNDGFWHRIEILVNKEIIKLKLDKFLETSHKNPWAHIIGFQEGNATLGGGEEQIMQGFVGCMYDIWVDDTGVNYDKLGRGYFAGVVTKCELQDRCLFTPCKHGGICSQDHINFKCDCLNTMYSGKTCEGSIYQPSCQDYKDLGLNDDAYCYIDPDGNGIVKPFKVLCNMTQNSKKAVTVIQHNLKEANIPVSKGVIEENAFYHHFKYGIGMEIFDVLLINAVKCRQFVQFRCKNALLMNSPRGPADTIWVGRKGTNEGYWGGAKPGSGMCACRYSKSCAQKYRFCNCDVGDDVWREDSGYFNQTDRLPVFMLRFKLTANQSFFTVGNLECEFNSSLLGNNLSKERVLKACHRLNEPPTTKPRVTNPTLNQRERIINWYRNKGFGEIGPTTKLHIDKPVLVPKVSVNVTVELPRINEDGSKKADGLKFTLSVYAVIVIAVATVIVVVIIAIVIIAKRCQRRRSRSRDNSDSEDGYETRREPTEMCTFFGSVSRSDSNRPVIEVHRHSIHCDTLEALPPAYREYGDYSDFPQPITTHIDLRYKPRKSLGIFC